MMGFVRKVRSYRRLSVAERGVVRAALRRLWFARPALLVHTVPVWRDRLKYSLSTVPDLKASRLAPRRIAKLVGTAAAYVWPSPSCLHRSLVLEALLRAHGFESELRFGLRRRGAAVEAHAWIEHQGEALTPPGDEHARTMPFVTAQPR